MAMHCNFNYYSPFKSSLVVKVIDLMEMVATGNAPQAKASKDEVFSVELQSQVGLF